MGVVVYYTTALCGVGFRGLYCKSSRVGGGVNLIDFLYCVMFCIVLYCFVLCCVVLFYVGFGVVVLFCVVL